MSTQHTRLKGMPLRQIRAAYLHDMHGRFVDPRSEPQAILTVETLQIFVFDLREAAVSGQLHKIL
jgi:hypothetical protein